MDTKLSPNPLFSRVVSTIAILLVLVPAARAAQPALIDTAPTSATVQTTSLEEMSIEELMNVKVTTVSRQESTVGQSPAAIFVITPDMIAHSGATAIAELLRMVPGANVASINSNQWGVTIRGFNGSLSNKLLVQVDGRTVYNAIYSGVYWDSVDYPLEDIERIEVIRGPGASVWGANAVNGIINIITKSAAATQGGLLVGSIGTFDKEHGTLRYGDTAGKAGHYRVFAKGFERGPGYNPGDEADDWRTGRVGFRYDTPQGDRDFTLEGDWFAASVGQRNIYENLNNPPTFRSTDTATVKIRGSNLLGRWSRHPDQKGGWSLQTYYDRTERRLTNGYAEAVIDTGDIDFQQKLLQSERNQLVYGLGYRFQKVLIRGSSSIDGAFAVSPAETSGSRNIASAFVEDQYKLRPALTLFLGSKVEHNYYTGFEYEPSVRVLYSHSPRHSAWAAISRAVRTPSLLEHNISISGVPFITPGGPIFPQLAANSNIDSERVVAHEIGYRAQPTNRLSVDTALFYNRYANLVGLRIDPLVPGPLPGSAVLPVRYANNEDATTYGFELSSTYSAGKHWQLTGAYSYLRMDVRPDASSVGLTAGLEADEGKSPHHQIYLRSSHELSSRLHLDIIARYVSALRGFNPVVPGYLTSDVQVAWAPRDALELAIVGQNLLDSHHPEFGPNPIPSEVRRSFYAKASLRW